jgi:hypothetical protein
MPVLTVKLEGDGAWPDLKGSDKLIHLADEARLEIAGLEAGMTSGKPSVALRTDLPDGRIVIAETSLALFLTAADLLKGRYGDPRQ